MLDATAIPESLKRLVACDKVPRLGWDAEAAGRGPMECKSVALGLIAQVF